MALLGLKLTTRTSDQHVQARPGRHQYSGNQHNRPRKRRSHLQVLWTPSRQDTRSTSRHETIHRKLPLPAHQIHSRVSRNQISAILQLQFLFPSKIAQHTALQISKLTLSQKRMPRFGSTRLFPPSLSSAQKKNLRITFLRPNALTTGFVVSVVSMSLIGLTCTMCLRLT